MGSLQEHTTVEKEMFHITHANIRCTCLWALSAVAILMVSSNAFATYGACPGAGDCCSPNGSPSCDDADCCESVCAQDAFCCETEWDQFCADAAADICVNCDGGGGGGGGGCAPACGKDNVACLPDGSGPAENARHVGQLLLNGSPWCTVWIVASPNLVMTNQHCVVGGNANQFSVRFNYECDACTGGSEESTVTFNVTEIVATNAGLDYAILRLSGDPASQFGQATIDPSAHSVGTAIYEIHHADGDVKAVDEGQITALNQDVCVDNESAVSVVAAGGASGSPVFRTENDCVTGICNCGPFCAPGFMVPMSNIWPSAGPQIAAAGGTVLLCGDDPTECGDPGTGSCFEPSATPFCDDAECCNAVCNTDNFCCETEWDEKCAAMAAQICDTPCGGDCLGDLNFDNIVSGADLGILLANWDTDGCGDLNIDGIVDGQDLGVLLAQWGECSPPKGECGEVGSGDCCDPNGTPFCDDALCCDLVCQSDPFCCESEWDDTCAGSAGELCDCSGGGNEGCGEAGTGDCCEATGTPFCDDQVCCDAICWADAFCCEAEWDIECADMAAKSPDCDCGGGGGGGEGCGEAGAGDCCVPNGSVACDDAACCDAICAADAFCCETEWDQLCADAAAKSADCNCGGGGGGDPACGEAGTGDCCEATGTPFCDDQVCCDAICAADAFCCETEWDQMCADMAAKSADCDCGGGGGGKGCGSPKSGSCFKPNGSPYCNDAACCETVCLADAFCCDTEWDQICADAAADTCDQN